MAAQAKIEDSNIALLGSDLEKEVRLAAAQSEAEWKDAGSQVGIEIWRVEKLGIKRWPHEEYGNFFDGDSYIVLHTYNDPDNQDKILYNVHFWLGENTTQDEAGVAAYKTVELDDLLGQLPVQYREVQGYESDEFLGLFEPSMKIMAGGIESGFNHVAPEAYEPRLLHVKGKKKVRSKQVPLSCDSLNQGDVFILDNGLELIQWNGDSAGVREKRKGNEIINQIKEERNGRPKSTVLDGDEDHDTFWTIIGGKGDIKSAEEGGDDEKVDAFTKRLLRVSDASGSLQLTEVATGGFGRNQLDSDDVFIVDTENAVYVWIGSGASKEERSQAFKVANEYLVQYNRPFTTSVVRVVEGAHSAAFEAAFH